jgi:predicted negative regulator of RcsB-dependent stress response
MRNILKFFGFDYFVNFQKQNQLVIYWDDVITHLIVPVVLIVVGVFVYKNIMKALKEKK